MGLCLPKDMCGAAEDANCEMGCITRDGQAQCTCDLYALSESDPPNSLGSGLLCSSQATFGEGMWSLRLSAAWQLDP